MVCKLITSTYSVLMSKKLFAPKTSSLPTRIGMAGVWLALLMSSAGIAYAGKDVVITTSGDRLVGEIKNVNKDLLTLSTDYSDSDFKIKWEKVASIESDRQFVVETFDGKRILGSLKPEAEKKAVTEVAGTSVPLPEVAGVQPIERSLWSRFDLGFNLGYSMTRANSAKQFSLGGNLSYRDERNLDSAFFNAFKNTQSNAPQTSQWQFGNDLRHFLGKQWYVNTIQDFLNSQEQGLDLRTTLGGGGGRYLFRTSKHYLALGGGLDWANENYIDPTVPTKNSAEAYVGTEFYTEKLKITDLVTRLTLYPSLTIPGRYRIGYTFNLDFNLPGDWYFRIGVYDNFDSQPPTGLTRNDYGWTNSFGLKF